MSSRDVVYLPEETEVNDTDILLQGSSSILISPETKKLILKAKSEGVNSSPISGKSSPSTSPHHEKFGSDKHRHNSLMSLSKYFNKGRKSDVPLKSFNVIKINKKNKEQERELSLTSYGILNIRPNGRVSSRESWSDVSICYKIDECTVAIKYKNSKRVYRASSKKKAEQLSISLRERMNANQEEERKQLRDKMLNGFDEKEKYDAVPNLQNEEVTNESEACLKEIVEKILLSTDSEIFQLKQRICGLKMTEFSKVKELRKYLDQFKYKIFEEKMAELSSVIDTKDPDANKCILGVIESVIESACLPSHHDEIYKLLNDEVKASDDLNPKIRLLKGKKQEFYGINKKLESSDNWYNAVVELVNFPKMVLPSAKMQCLLDTARHINLEAKKNYKKEITGDDLLPIVIFVLVNASFTNGKIIITAADELFIQILINPEALQGERGYYLCVFSAALEFVRNYDRKKIEERFNTIRRLKDFGFF